MSTIHDLEAMVGKTLFLFPWEFLSDKDVHGNSNIFSFTFNSVIREQGCRIDMTDGLEVKIIRRVPLVEIKHALAMAEWENEKAKIPNRIKELEQTIELLRAKLREDKQ